MPKRNVTPYTTRAPDGKIVTKVHQSLLAGATVLALLIALACGGGGGPDGADDPPTTTAGNPSTSVEQPTTTMSTDNAVRSAYEGFVSMLQRITTTTVDPNDAELSTRMVDPGLSDVRTNLSTWQAQGQIWVVGDRTGHHIESVQVDRDGLSAVVTVCAVSNDALVLVGEENPIFPPPQTNRGTTTLVNQDGSWRVQETKLTEHWEGVAGCAA